jgi:ribonuclease HI
MAVEESDACLVELRNWKLFFDWSVCSRGCGIGCVLVSPHDVDFELAVRLEFACTYNQVEYEALLHGLDYLRNMGVRGVDAFGDSMLVVQQVKGESHCMDGVLNNY